MVKIKKIPGLEINPGKGSAFDYETQENLPQLHQNCLLVAPRGGGKTTALVNLLERLPYDRIIVVSPSVLSNKDLMTRLKLDPADIFQDPDDLTTLDKIKAIIDTERDDLDKYRDDMKRWEIFNKNLSAKNSMFNDEYLLDFYDASSNNFKKPTHKYGGRKPCIGVVFDDCIGSAIYSKGIRKLNQFVIFHRHQGQLKAGGAIGCSLFFLVQSFRCQSGGLSKTIRNNTTSMLVWKTKSQRELEEIAEECGGEVDRDTFMKLVTMATEKPHDFLFIDLHKKKSHPSMFRRNFDEFLIVD